MRSAHCPKPFRPPPSVTLSGVPHSVLSPAQLLLRFQKMSNVPTALQERGGHCQAAVALPARGRGDGAGQACGAPGKAPQGTLSPLPPAEGPPALNCPADTHGSLVFSLANPGPCTTQLLNPGTGAPSCGLSPCSDCVPKPGGKGHCRPCTPTPRGLRLPGGQ